MEIWGVHGLKLISNSYNPCVKSLMACSIRLTCPTLVTPKSFKSLRAKERSSLPRMSFFSKLSMYSDSCSVSNHVATSCVPHEATSLFWLDACGPKPAPFVRNFNQNSPFLLCSA